MSRGWERSGGGGLSIAGRFCLFMTLSMLVVMSAAGFFLLDKSRDALEKANQSYMRDTARLTAAEQFASEGLVTEILGQVKSGFLAPEEAIKRLFQPHGATYEDLSILIDHGRLGYHRVNFTSPSADMESGFLIEYDGMANLLAPEDVYGGQRKSLFGLILLVTAVVLAVSAGVAFVVSAQVTKPIELLVDDVRSISRGNLHHRTRVKGGGEVYHLARQIDRMAQSLEEAQEAEVELGVREREREVAQEVREALLPERCPQIPGYQISDLHVAAPEPGGDFHDFVGVGDRLVMMICEVSGRGVPGALVGATARAYMHSELERGGSLEEALEKINRSVARDMRRGMYVTALCVGFDPAQHVVTVACAGHKIPLIRYEAATRQIRLIQPEGIALGFDKGPVFDRSLKLMRVPLGPGDRLVLSNTGPVQVVDAEGEELGEKAFYRVVARNARRSPADMLTGILASLEEHADGEDFPADISLLILARDA